MSGAEVCILGGAGFGGGELMRLLVNHPRVGRIRAVSRRRAGEPVHRVHPHLRGLLDATFETDIDWARWSAESPVVFAALPGLAFARQYADLCARWRAVGLSDRLLLIDLSGDFRLADPDLFAARYGERHPCPEGFGEFAYGLAEWMPERLRGERRIANPGCFATALALALLPLTDLASLGRVCITGLTGSSGSGARPLETTHHATRSNDLRAYKVLRHQHLGEIEALLAATDTRADIGFVPHSAPLARGIFATLQFDLEELGIDAHEFAARYPARYADARFVRLVEDTPRVAAVAGTNFCDIAVHAEGRHAAVLVALDNLGKGMAGQAVQNLNLARGWDEAAGLRLISAYPG